MIITPPILKDLIAAELGMVGDERVVAAVRGRLVEPRAVVLDWDYGAPGQQFTGWLVFDDSAGSNTEIVYCAEGFGPSSPWGLINAGDLNGRRLMGMDSGWFRTFPEAYLDSYPAGDLSIRVVGETDPDGISRVLSEEADMLAAFAVRDRLAAANGAARYEVRHTVQVRP